MQYLRLALIIGLVAVFSLGLALGLSLMIPGLGRPEPGYERIPEGVMFVHGDTSVPLGGLTRYEATGLVEDLAPSFTVLPQDAYLDRATRGVVPGLEGRGLDVAAVIEKALASERGGLVGPSYCPVPAAVTLSDFPEAPVYRGNPGKKAVAVILNVAWGDEYLDGLLTIAEKAGARLTVCPAGTWLDGDEERAAWLAAASSRGHEIGNHGYYNRPMTYNAEQITREIERTSDLIEAACGSRPVIFAPPMGEFNQGTLTAAAALGCRTVIWSLDTVDWRREGVDVISRRVTSRVGPGDIILCHPTEQTGPAMEQFLRVIREKGLAVVTVSELLSPEVLAEEDGPPGGNAPEGADSAGG